MNRRHRTMTLEWLFTELEKADWGGHKSLPTHLKNASVVMEFFGKDRVITSIAYMDVQDFVAYLTKKYGNGSSVNRKLAPLSKAFTFARRVDPSVSKPEMPRAKENKARSRILSAAQVTALVNWEGWKPASKDYVTVLADTGCRGKSDMKAFRIEDGEVTFLDTKNGDERTVALTEEALAALGRMQKRPLIRYHTFLGHFRKAVEALGLPEDVVPYTLRHTAITRLSERGANIVDIQQFAGHRSVATTSRYIKQTRESRKKMLGMLAR